MVLIDNSTYHTYRFDWHSGEFGNATSSYVDFYIDDIYMGTNNAFVPSRGSRLSLSLWGAGCVYRGGCVCSRSSGALVLVGSLLTAPGDTARRWNGWPNNWGGGKPGDGKSYTQTAYVSSVKITPFNEPNDIMYMALDDQPSGCHIPLGRCTC